MGESAHFGQLALNKRSHNAGRQACDAPNLGRQRAHAVEFSIRFRVRLGFLRNVYLNGFPCELLHASPCPL